MLDTWSWLNKFFLLQKQKISTKLSTLLLKENDKKTSFLTKLLWNCSCNDHYATFYSTTNCKQMQVVDYSQQGDGWDLPTKLGRAVEESGQGSDMKIQACFTVR